MKKLLIASLIGLVALSACADRATSNVQTVVSEDCGQNWKLIPVGEAVPLGTGNWCFQKATVPNYPMVGESNFRGNFANNVRVNVNSGYDYTITDALKYIRFARFVTRQGSSGDDAQNGASVWDAAEGIVIDRQIREVANSTAFLLSQDITTFEPGEFETAIFTKINEVLADRGVQLDSFTFTVTPDDQTRNMLDIDSALRVCKSIEGMTPEGCQTIITARAGATRMTVNTGTNAPLGD